MKDVFFGDTAFTSGRAKFAGAAFHCDVRFGGVSVQPGDVDLDGAMVTNLAARLEWPAGWQVESLEDGTGRLMRVPAP